MAKFNQNDNKTDISAITGNSGVVATWHGRTVFSKKPAPSKRKGNSAKLQTTIDLFKEAHYYAAGFWLLGIGCWHLIQRDVIQT